MDYGNAILIDRPVKAGGTTDISYLQWGTGLGFLLNLGADWTHT